MNTNLAKCNFVDISNSDSLENIVRGNIEEGAETSYYLILNSWDKVSLNFRNIIAKSDNDGPNTVNVVDIFDIPNVFGVIKSAIQESRETISTVSLKSIPKVPCLVVLHKAFPRVVDYNGSILAELGL